MGNNMDRILQRPAFPKFAEPLDYVSTEIMTNGISEFGWTNYLDVSVDTPSEEKLSSLEIEKRRTKRTKYKHNAEKYGTYQPSSITGKEEDPSMASDASSGPQSLSLPVRDIERGQEQQVAGSFFSVSRDRSDVQDLESIGSCSTADVNPRKINLRKVDESEHDLLLQDTASSGIHRLEAPEKYIYWQRRGRKERFEALESFCLKEQSELVKGEDVGKEQRINL